MEIPKYITPVKRILTPEDLQLWQSSASCAKVYGFVKDLADSIDGKTNDAETMISPTTQSIIDILEEVKSIVARNPVAKDKAISRFGKIEFRDFADELTSCSKELLLRIPELKPFENSEKSDDPRTELKVYFDESWGNRTRIDYGSGHELNFISFLLCLKELNYLKPEDYQTIVLKIFTKYLSIMRSLQKEYWLEPAGSHGVWGLDDYHFLPFLFGASQLVTHPNLRPKSIHNADMIEMFHDKYMYFDCISFINSIKNASLRWHSPMLDDISGVRTWSKVAEGMGKMFAAEVLGKLPIAQHFFFGNILKAPEGVTEPNSAHEDACGHTHTEEASSHSTWADCCGIKVPSAVAAAEMNRLNTGGFKPIPSD